MIRYIYNICLLLVRIANITEYVWGICICVHARIRMHAEREREKGRGERTQSKVRLAIDPSISDSACSDPCFALYVPILTCHLPRIIQLPIKMISHIMLIFRLEVITQCTDIHISVRLAVRSKPSYIRIVYVTQFTHVRF